MPHAMTDCCAAATAWMQDFSVPLREPSCLPQSRYRDERSRETGRNYWGKPTEKLLLEGTLIAMLSVSELSRRRDTRSGMQYAVA
jgi:hypothetical protein